MSIFKTGLLISAGVVAAVLAAPEAQGTTYTGSRDVGQAHIDLSITTDGHVGVLGFNNLLNWQITITDPGGTGVFINRMIPNPSNSSEIDLELDGSALTATPTSLSFDFDQQSGFNAVLFGQPGNSKDIGYELVASLNPDFPGTEYATTSYEGAIHQNTMAGTQVIATAAGGVPEPASWAMLLIGFGALGTASRRTRQVAA